MPAGLGQIVNSESVKGDTVTTIINQETGTLPPAIFANIDRQQVFDDVLAHLRAQKTSAANDSGWCVYRNAQGLKCAVGALIPDSFYDPAFEGSYTAEDIVNYFGGDFDTQRFMRDIQIKLHDDPHCHSGSGVNSKRFLAVLEENAKIFATYYGLTYTPPVEGDV